MQTRERLFNAHHERAERTTQVAIIGAGLAGHTCADLLQQQRIPATLYEAHGECIGGRRWSARDFVDGQVAEHGGEFIDSRQTRMQDLAVRFGLTLKDRADGVVPGHHRLWLDGAPHRPGELTEARRFRRRRISADAPGSAHTAGTGTHAAVEFDAMTVRDWVQDNVPGGADGLEGRRIATQMAAELGLDTDELSALNLFFEYAAHTVGADERFHIAGGNDQVVTGLADCLVPGAIQLGRPLNAVWERADGTYGLSFDSLATDVVVDHVALCLPFMMRRRVDLSGLHLSDRKAACIEDLGMGTNSKVLLQFDDRPASYGRWSGSFWSDEPT